MGKTLPFIGLVIIGLYVGVNYWIGRRIWQLCGRFIPLLDRKVYWALYWLIAAAYWVGRYSTEIMPSALNRWFVIAGAYWLAAIYYFGLIFAVFDLLRWINKRWPFVPAAWQHRRRLVIGFGFSIVLFVTGLVAYGGWNALNPAVCRYDVTIAKSGGALAQL
ncbi:MAG: metallophosphoesterase, partial [Heliobacteriaceae bacterium]|nr:metallophosphoesterase [Heliobacteriaceae bacterium]